MLLIKLSCTKTEVALCIISFDSNNSIEGTISMINDSENGVCSLTSFRVVLPMMTKRRAIVAIEQ